MGELFVNNKNARAAAEPDADSSYGDSASSARDNAATETTFISRRSSTSFGGSSDGAPWPEIIPKLQVVPSFEEEDSLLKTTDCEDSHSLQPPDPAALDAIRGQVLSVPVSNTEIKQEPSVISDLGNREYKKVVETSAFPPNPVETSDEETDSELPLEAPLQDKLLADHHKFHDGRKGFIPRGHIKRVVTEQAVTQHLHECLHFSSTLERDRTIRRYVRQIFSKGPERKSYIIIFTILVLTEMSECIVDFLKEQVDDSGLPFQKHNKKPQKRIPKIELRTRRGLQRIEAFDEWSLVKKMSFEEWQWAVNAPFFNRGENGEAKIYSLQDPAVLPFVTRNTVSGNQEIEEHHGGFGKVSKKYIHHDHHNLKKCERKDIPFAIKKLNSKNEEEFKAEFDILAKLGKTKHPHLVSLLGAYRQLSDNYLIFDWADSDLAKYWRAVNPHPDFSLRTVCWVAEQCLGLASGLQQIHRYGSIEQEKRPGDHSFKKLYGRHGDIKPENILWYCDSNSPGDLGTLRICDFGVSEFHSTQSRSGIRNSHVAMSPYYRPPESELQDGKISRSYDIWTMGCLYLEFLGWLLGGWPLVRDMVIARNPHPTGDHGPNLYFDYPYYDLDDSRKRANIKSAVTKFIEDAHSNSKCSEFVHDFLDIIQKQLLVVETQDAGSSKRIGCGRLHRLLLRMFNKCKNKPEYAVKAKPRTAK